MWRVALKFSDETYEFDEEFDTEKEAFDYGQEMRNDYFLGSSELTMRDPDENPYEEWADEDPEILVWEEED